MKKIILFLVLILSIGLVYGDSATMSVTVGSAGPSVDSVSVADADPTSGSTTEITITSQITDTNGVDDINLVKVEFTVGTPANGNTIEANMTDSCTNVDSDTIECVTTYDMQFYDPAQTYTIQVTAEDAGAATHAITDDFAYSALVALELDATALDFGSVQVGAPDTIPGDEDMGTGGAPTIKNQGNAVIDAAISATDFIGPTDSFGAEEADSQFGALGWVALSNGGRTETGLDLATGASSLENVDFRLTIPVGALPETYSSTVTITAVTNS
jgi:hypothetical protein|tara:strand:+ start:2337 stop:3152 length:816 start_codon:yes stop_codon:yes gene_type:complete